MNNIFMKSNNDQSSKFSSAGALTQNSVTSLGSCESKQIIYRKREESEFSINLTNACPNECIFCVREKSKGWFKESQLTPINLYLKSDPSLNEVLSAVEEELLRDKNNPAKLIKFCGYGEPILKCSFIINAALMIKRYSPSSKVQVNTSGWPYFSQYNNFDVLIHMKNAGVEIFSVSLNAPTQELYTQITRPRHANISSSAFYETLRFIKVVKDLGFKVRVTFVDIPEIHDYIPDCINLCKTLGVEAMVRELDTA